MNALVVILGIAFLGFILVVALRGRSQRRAVTDQVCEDMDYIYEQTQKRHVRQRGRASSELADARASHLKVIDGRASASK